MKFLNDLNNASKDVVADSFLLSGYKLGILSNFVKIIQTLNEFGFKIPNNCLFKYFNRLVRVFVMGWWKVFPVTA